MGTPDFARVALAALVAAGTNHAVYCQPPKPQGAAWRNRNPRCSASPRSTHCRCARAAIARPGGAGRARGVRRRGRRGRGLRLILPAPILRAPRLGCLKHPCLAAAALRGAAPIQRALLEGDARPHHHHADGRGPRHRPHFAQRGAADRGRRDRRLAPRQARALGGRMIVDALQRLAAARCRRRRSRRGRHLRGQADARRRPARLEQSRPRHSSARCARSRPGPAAWFETGGERIKVLAARLGAGSGPPGAVIGPGLTIACGDGALRLARVQRAGRAAMDDGVVPAGRRAAAVL